MKRVDSPSRRFPYLPEQHHYFAGAGPGGDDAATEVANNALWLPNWDIRLTDNDLVARDMSAPFDVMKDVVVRAGIRDSMIADMARALKALADWPSYASEHELPDDVAGAQEFAEMALRNYRETRKRI